ncbi:hypothetical protein ACFPIJ_33000 [Dactylosporangium cerinum]|uniref:Uncharacterized protein n=1 Tax=Dactylosporangium cerinum TaxID=1434730 RepID=A0ABV9W1X4_9ACTN
MTETDSPPFPDEDRTTSVVLSKILLPVEDEHGRIGVSGRLGWTVGRSLDGGSCS